MPSTSQQPLPYRDYLADEAGWEAFGRHACAPLRPALAQVRQLAEDYATDPKAMWEAAAARGLVPEALYEDPKRCYWVGFGSGTGSTHRAWGEGLRPAPPGGLAQALAADPAGVLAAEALAVEVAQALRLTARGICWILDLERAWGLFQTHRSVYPARTSTVRRWNGALARSRPGAFGERLDPVFEAYRRGLDARPAFTRHHLDSNLDLDLRDLYAALTWEDGLAQGWRVGRERPQRNAGRRLTLLPQAPSEEEQLSYKLLGSLAQVPNPYPALLTLWATGYYLVGVIEEDLLLATAPLDPPR